MQHLASEAPGWLCSCARRQTQTRLESKYVASQQFFFSAKSFDGLSVIRNAVEHEMDASIPDEDVDSYCLW